MNSNFFFWLTRAGFLVVILLLVFLLVYLIRLLLLKQGRKFIDFISSVGKSVGKAVAENPDIKKFTNRHKRFFSFLRRRFDRTTFLGLPLTLFSLALAYVLLLMGGIIEDVVTSDVIVSADVQVAHLLAAFRGDWITDFFLKYTLLGKWQIIVLIAAAAIFIFWFGKMKSFILPLIISIAGGEGFTGLGKIAFHRPRPDVAIYHESTWSFPSGHATAAMAFYGFLFYVLIRSASTWKRKINFLFTGFIIISLLGFSRLYLGVHFVSDVWGGYLSGTLWLIIAMSLSEYLISRKPGEPVANFSGSGIKRLSMGIAMTGLVGGILFTSNYNVPLQEQPGHSKHSVVFRVEDIFTTEQLKYTETLLGRRQEPLSFVILAKSDNSLIDLFHAARWFPADGVNWKSLYKIAGAAFFNKSYPRSPMTPDFWNSQVHNFGFEKETTARSARTRHHARFWKTGYKTADGYNIYVGTASFDSGIKWGVTHTISPDIDTEREFLFTDLEKTGLIGNSDKRQFVQPELGSNFSGDMFFTDGNIYFLVVHN